MELLIGRPRKGGCLPLSAFGMKLLATFVHRLWLPGGWRRVSQALESRGGTKEMVEPRVNSPSLSAGSGASWQYRVQVPANSCGEIPVMILETHCFLAYTFPVCPVVPRMIWLVYILGFCSFFFKIFPFLKVLICDSYCRSF